MLASRLLRPSRGLALRGLLPSSSAFASPPQMSTRLYSSGAPSLGQAWDVETWTGDFLSKWSNTSAVLL